MWSQVVANRLTTFPSKIAKWASYSQPTWAKIPGLIILMELPVGAEKEKLLQNIEGDKHLYDLFRSKQAFEQLNKDVEEYRKFKQQQGVQ